MNKLILLLTLFTLLFYANAHSSEEWEKLCAEGNSAYTIYENPYAIGFNESKSLYAYIGRGYYEGMGSYYWELNIYDSSDKLIKYVEYIVGTEPQNHPAESVLQKMYSEAGKYDIKLNKISDINDFPVSTDNALIDAYLFAGEKKENNGVGSRLLKIYLADNFFGYKQIGEAKEVVFFGHKKKFGHKIKGFLRDPVSDNLAVVVLYYTSEDEESDVICRYKLLVANTKIKHEKNNKKTDFLKMIVEQAPYKINTYINRGDNYWVLKDYVNAKRSYQAYIELMKFKGDEKSIPTYVLERIEMNNKATIK